MFFRKTLAIKSATVKNFSFADFSACQDRTADLSSKTAAVTFNFGCFGGALVQSLGFDLFQPAKEMTAKAVFSFCFDGDDRLAVLDDKNILHLFSDGTFQEVCSCEGMPCFLRLDRENRLLVFDENGMRIFDGSLQKIDGAPKAVDAALFFERVFAAEGDKLCFSQELDCTNWDEAINSGGYLRLDDDFGEILRVLPFDGKLFVFGKNKIARVTASAGQPEFFVEKIFAAHGDIFARTVAVCGDKILFLASDGLHSFDGEKTQKLFASLDRMFCGGEPVAVTFGAKYYLACKMDFADGRKILCERGEFVNNAVLELSDKVRVCRGADVSSFAEAEGKLFFASKGKVGFVCDSGKFFDMPLPKVWQSGEGDFGTPHIKTLGRLFVKTATDLCVVVVADGQKHRFFVEGKKEPQQIKLGVSGTRFSVSLETSSARPQITCPTFEVKFEGGVS